MVSPRPVPFFLVEKKGVKRCFKFSGLMPRLASFTVSSRQSPRTSNLKSPGMV